MNVLKTLVKLAGILVILGATVALPAIGEESVESKVRVCFAKNTSRGIVKGFELQGKTVSEEEKQYIYARSLETADEIILLVKAAGLLDEYAKQIFDPEIRELDERVLKATDIREVGELLKQQIAIMSSKYPTLYTWTITSTEAADVMNKFLVDIAVKVCLKTASK